jgi:hypothetical protein
MPYKQPIKLKVMTDSDFAGPARLLLLLVLLSASLSPYPFLLIVAVLFVPLVMWKLNILGFSKVNDAELTLIIFPDGLLRLESTDGKRLDGFLDSQQWATQTFAVLRFKHVTGNRLLVVFSRQQQKTEDFRRLTVMLRQGFYDRTESKLISGA